MRKKAASFPRKDAPGAPRLLACAAFALFLAACGLPKDPEGTLDRVQGGTLRVGLVAGEADRAADRALLRGFARTLGAQLTIEEAETHRLLDRLDRGELDLVVSLPKSTPFRKAGYTRPVPSGDAPRVWAVRSGENGFLMEAERFLAAQEPGQ